MRGRNSSSSRSSRSSSSSSSSSRSSSRGRSNRGGGRTQTPVSRLKNSISNRISSRSRSRGGRRSSSSGMGFWGYTLIGLGVVGVGYGLSFISSVRSFMSPVIDPVSSLFGLLDDDGIDTTNLTHDRTYSGSTVGSSMGTGVGSGSM